MNCIGDTYVKHFGSGNNPEYMLCLFSSVSYTVCSPNHIMLCMLCTIMCSVDRGIDRWMNRYVFSHVNPFSYVAGLPGVLQGIRS